VIAGTSPAMTHLVLITIFNVMHGFIPGISSATLEIALCGRTAPVAGMLALRYNAS